MDSSELFALPWKITLDIGARALNGMLRIVPQGSLRSHICHTIVAAISDVSISAGCCTLAVVLWVSPQRHCITNNGKLCYCLVPYLIAQTKVSARKPRFTLFTFWCARLGNFVYFEFGLRCYVGKEKRDKKVIPFQIVQTKANSL